MAAQNAWVEYTLQDPTHHYDSDTGAFTGEVSAEMLEDLDVVGHLGPFRAQDFAGRG